MADLVTLRTALQRMGFSQDAAVNITTVQGYQELDDFKHLMDDEIDNLAHGMRRPGGTIPNPAGAGTVPNPGILVPSRATHNLKLMCYYLRYKERLSRPVTATDITIPHVRAIERFRQNEKDHEDVEAPELNFKDWTKTIETIEEYLFGCLGTTKIPLAYIIRPEVEVTPSADDPPANYDTVQEEMVARAPHHDGADPPVNLQAYKDDNIKVSKMLADLLRNSDGWTYIKKAARKRDGRQAFLALKNHFLGPNNVDNMAKQAEDKLGSTTYLGEQRRWTFEKYVRIHVDQHTILEGLTEHGYSGIDPRSKVRYLLRGIKTKEFDHVKATIIESATLRKDFDACVNLFQDFIKQSSGDRIARVSAVNNRNNNRSNNQNSNNSAEGRKVQAVNTQSARNNTAWENVRPDMTIPDRYYNRQEYSKLTVPQKKGLSLKRKARGHQAGARDSTVETGNAPQRRRINAVNRVRDETDDVPYNDISGDEQTIVTVPVSNRRNQALRRRDI